MATQLMREALRPLYHSAREAHPGLLIQRGYPVYDQETEEGREAKTRHLQRICAVTPTPFYHNAYQRWRTATADPLRFRQIQLALESRLFIGLTGGGMLETGCAISHSYGMPYIPGSSVKGVVRAHVCGSPFADKHPEVIAELFGAEADPMPEAPYPQGLSGLVSFHDAWWVPGSAERPLVEEIVTTHHLEYYGSEGRTPATDFDSPIPNAQIAVQGHCLFVLEGPPAWLDLAQQMLIAALSKRGIGAKTRTGYGLFDFNPQKPAGPVCAWVNETIERLAQQNKTNSEEVLRSKGLAAEWAALTDAALKAEALEDIRSRWQEKERDWWDNPPGKSAKQARALYDE
ncbi:type III-B CRISPR module RAMP protein Cmr6 [Allochromatium vinosum]|uniref:CRISPR-associated RAMP protein, Cmr6 family n=1 Tax=Allochromatium vinosum (strain ATCC 17899 / DSM 180 / NBRC 103801 / NCIMB 10441 / D) TaxID=572477 RepID=D3RW20_ALLVD|nr:type III-B CRISPR module RAMP protein Cmr6 [Allochromatium vinosum]ADC64032.1 CRISPR-associated RAMP protein, Cmr6 family [Allochromatium vinosum DSM 180]